MKNAKSSATVLGIGLVLIVIALVAVLYSMGPIVVEKPVYVQETVPVFVQPAWWGSFGAPWGYKSSYDKPWKMGSGIPGMKVPHPPPPPPPAAPVGPAPAPPAAAPPTPPTA